MPEITGPPVPVPPNLHPQPSQPVAPVNQLQTPPPAIPPKNIPALPPKTYKDSFKGTILRRPVPPPLDTLPTSPPSLPPKTYKNTQI